MGSQWQLIDKDDNKHPNPPFPPTDAKLTRIGSVEAFTMHQLSPREESWLREVIEVLPKG
jgi:hypothetical protein